MPFKSTKQKKFMQMNHPDVAEKLEHEKGGLAGMVGKKLFGKKKKKMATTGRKRAI